MNNSCVILDNKKKVRTYSYQEYIDLMDQYVRLDITSGADQGREKLEATKLNFIRMKRWNKTIVLPEDLLSVIQQLPQKQCWTIITEAWCGDGGQIIPALAKIAEHSNDNIRLQLVFRDDNPELITNYLTNGSKAIPKLFARTFSQDELFTWGPRPAGAIQIMTSWKENPGTRTKEAVMMELHAWYAKNQQQDVFSEIKELLTSGSGNQPV
ncbi:MAG: thioredoxin family protein [Bacteroidetes bacterium]|nr:thioredoxin family protein [Bacteroidota bacterium]